MKVVKNFSIFCEDFLKKMIKIATITTSSIILREKLRYTIRTSLALLLRLSFLGTIRDTDILLSLDFNESASSIIDLAI